MGNNNLDLREDITKVPKNGFIGKYRCVCTDETFVGNTYLVTAGRS